MEAISAYLRNHEVEINKREFIFELYVMGYSVKEETGSYYKDVFCDITNVREWVDDGTLTRKVDREDIKKEIKSHIDLEDILDEYGN